MWLLSSTYSITMKCLDLQLVAYDTKRDLQSLLILCIWRNVCSNPPVISWCCHLLCSWVVCLHVCSRYKSHCTCVQNRSKCHSLHIKMVFLVFCISFSFLCSIFKVWKLIILSKSVSMLLLTLLTLHTIIIKIQGKFTHKFSLKNFIILALILNWDIAFILS